MSKEPKTLRQLIFHKYGAGRMKFACGIIAQWVNGRVTWAHHTPDFVIEEMALHPDLYGKPSRPVDKALKQLFGCEIKYTDK